MPEKRATANPIELTRGLLESGPSDIDGTIASFADDAVCRALPLGQTLEGAAEIRSFLEDWLSAYAEYVNEPEEIRDLGSGVVLAVTRQEIRLAGSPQRIRMSEVFAYVFVWAGEKVTRVEIFDDVDEARATAERLAGKRGTAVPGGLPGPSRGIL